MFKSKKELESEQNRLQKKELRDANRSCDRLQADLDRQITDIESQIKTAAKKGDTVQAKTLAKHLIKLRQEKVRAIEAKSKISSITSHANSIKVNSKLADVMSKSASAMSQMNKQLKPEQVAQQVNQFQAETMKMDIAGSAFDGMFDELFEGESDEADSIMTQVLDELAIDTSATLSKLPTTVAQSTGSKQSIKSDPASAIGHSSKAS